MQKGREQVLRSNPTQTSALNYNKKYSLRQKKQNLPKAQLQPRYLVQLLPSKPPSAPSWAPPPPYPHRQESSFNCINSVQNVLDFNRANSIGLSNQPLKTLSTTPSSLLTPMGTVKHDSRAVYGARLSADMGQRVHTQSSQHNSDQSIRGDVFNQLTNSSHKQSKLSLKQTPNNRKPVKQLFMCLNYQDIDINNLQQINGLSTHRSHQWTKDLFCGNGANSKTGCKCSPICRWTLGCLDLINRQGFQPQRINNKTWSDTQWQSTLKQIDKDLPRTQPDHFTFQNSQYLTTLRQVLIQYAQMDPQVGYVQGMNFLAAGIIFHARNVQNSLLIFAFIMQKRHFRSLFIDDLKHSDGLAQMCVRNVRRLIFDLFCHMEHNDVQLQIFIRSWYFSMLGNFVPLEALHLIVETYIRGQFTGLNQLIITLLIKLKPGLMQLQDNQLMQSLTVQKLTTAARSIDWADLVLRSERLNFPTLL